MKKTNKNNPAKSIRTVSDLALTIEKYRLEVKLHEHILTSGLKDVRRSFTQILEESVKSYTQQWAMKKGMNWIQSYIFKKRKSKKKNR